MLIHLGQSLHAFNLLWKIRCLGFFAWVGARMDGKQQASGSHQDQCTGRQQTDHSGSGKYSGGKCCWWARVMSLFLWPLNLQTKSTFACLSRIFYLCKEEWCRRSLSSSSPHRADTQPTLLWSPPGKIMEIWAMSYKSQLWARLSPLFNLSFLREWTLRLVSRPIEYLLFDRQQQSSPFFPLVQAINHPKIDLVTPPLLQVTYSLLCQMWTHSRDNLLPSLDRWQDEPSHLIKSTEWLSHRELAREHTWRMTKHRTRNTNLCVASAHCHTKQRLSDFSQHVSKSIMKWTNWRTKSVIYWLANPLRSVSPPLRTPSIVSKYWWK